MVLNDSRIRGLAAATAARLRGAGWPVSRVGNLPGRIRRTTVYYDAAVPGAAAAAGRLAALLGGLRVLPHPAWLPAAGALVLVVTRM